MQGREKHSAGCRDVNFSSPAAPNTNTQKVYREGQRLLEMKLTLASGLLQRGCTYWHFTKQKNKVWAWFWQLGLFFCLFLYCYSISSMSSWIIKTWQWVCSFLQRGAAACQRMQADPIRCFTFLAQGPSPHSLNTSTHTHTLTLYHQMCKMSNCNTNNPASKRAKLYWGSKNVLLNTVCTYCRWERLNTDLNKFQNK